MPSSCSAAWARPLVMRLLPRAALRSVRLLWTLFCAISWRRAALRRLTAHLCSGRFWLCLPPPSRTPHVRCVSLCSRIWDGWAPHQPAFRVPWRFLVLQNPSRRAGLGTKFATGMPLRHKITNGRLDALADAPRMAHAKFCGKIRRACGEIGCHGCTSRWGPLAPRALSAAEPMRPRV